MLKNSSLFICIFLSAFLCPSSLWGQLFISEFSARNSTGIQDQDGDYEDWIEIHNSGPASVSLDGLYLSDDELFLSKWQLPNVQISAGGFYIIFASGKNRVDPMSELHTNFSLDKDGEFLALVDSDGQTILNSYAPSFPEQYRDVSYGLEFGGGGAVPGSYLFFDMPTPGQANGFGYQGVLAKPTFLSPPACFSSTSILIEFDVPPGVEIRYTTDGSIPTASSTLYSPFPITSSTRIRARAYQSGFLPSGVRSGSFIALSPSLNSVDSNLPLIVINSPDGDFFGSIERDVDAVFIEADAGMRTAILDVADDNVQAGMKIRGSSSASFPKKQYSFEVRDENGDDHDESLLGMPKESDWVIYAPYSDKSLMRNYLAYKWSNEMGLYASRTRFAEVYLHTGSGRVDSGDYAGVYLLIEKIKGSDNRVDIASLEPGDNSFPEVSGGYIFKKDRLDPGDQGFNSSQGHLFAYVEPKESDISAAQSTWLSDFIGDFENALYGPNFSDPLLGYESFINTQSFVDNLLLVELTRNIDGYRLSTFFNKDREGKLKTGPVWDYNLSLGNADYNQGWLDSGWYYDILGPSDFYWFMRLLQDNDFVQLWQDRWTSLRRGVFSNQQLMLDIQEAQDILTESQQRNFQRWQILGQYVWPNWFIASTWLEELNFMKGWLNKRLTWMDEQSLRAPFFSVGDSVLQSGSTIRIATAQASSSTYYTTDGTDPREQGGAIAPSALLYTANGQLDLLSDQVHQGVKVFVPGNSSLGTDWTDVSFDDSSWQSSMAGTAVGYEGGTGYAGFIDLDVQSIMQGSNSSIYIRYDFDLVDPNEYRSLKLKMRYDDGFVAYLNGVEVARANAPSAVDWNSQASTTHPDSQAIQFEEFQLADGAWQLLLAGANRLAIHGLNSSSSNEDFLMQAELEANDWSGNSISVQSNMQLRARSYMNGQWSGLAEADVLLQANDPIRVTELMYHPLDPVQPSPYTAGDFEFVELQNTSMANLSLAGLAFTDGIDFDFANSPIQQLQPEEYIVVVKNLLAFETLYDTSNILIAGEFLGSLSNGGENIQLIRNSVLVQEFEYDDGWYPTTDGQGASLEVVDSSAPVADWNEESHWQASMLDHGTPGEGPGGTSAGGWQQVADINQDNALNVADVLTLLNILFSGQLQLLPCEPNDFDGVGNQQVMDANNDNSVSIADPLFLLSYLFTGGSPPPLGLGCVPMDTCPINCSP